jgi:aminoglycoside phosphotransferase (APT) family kinase protein
MEGQKTSKVQKQNEFDILALQRYILPFLGVSLPLDPMQIVIGVEEFNLGQSNPTYKLDVEGRKYVMRKTPAGKQLVSSAHRVDRE